MGINNRVSIIGYIGHDIELKYTTKGDVAIARASVASQERYKDSETQEIKTRPEWHRVVFIGNRAEIINKYAGKGSHVAIVGKLRTSRWQDKNGIDRWTTEIICQEITLLDKKPSEKEALETPADVQNQADDTDDSVVDEASEFNDDEGITS